MLGLIIIKNGYIYFNDSLIEGSIIIDSGKIEGIVKDYSLYINRADKVIDAKGLPITPGGIDVHAHIYDPDYTHHEDWFTGTRAAAFGGITTVFDMPLRLYVDDIDKLRLKVENGLKNAIINFGVHAGMMGENNLSNIPGLALNGVVGFKVFTVKPFKASDNAIVKIMELVRSYNGVVMVHAEDDALIDKGLERVAGRNDPLAHHEARSDLAEATAIAKVGFYELSTSTHVHIVHTSSKIGAETIGYLKNLGARITAETCPQYLFFTRDDVRKWGNYLKITPSLKTRHDVEGLWRALANGVIDVVASDHAPSPREEKETDVWSAWGGIPVIELIIPFIYTYGVSRNKLSFNRFVEVVSVNPAKIMNLYPHKGLIAPGSDADIVVLDTRYCTKVDPAKLHHKVDWNPFEGLEMCGWPLHVIVNGKPVIEDRELVAKPGSGKFVGEILMKYHREVDTNP